MPSSTYENDLVFMNCAIEFSTLSKAKRKKVGAVLVTKHGVLVPSVNGTPSGTSNICEEAVFDGVSNKLVTKEEVLHSETNCLIKCSKEGISTLGSTIYITLSPCLKCSSMLIQAGVERVVYLEEYRCKKGLDFLRSCGILVQKLIIEKETE